VVGLNGFGTAPLRLVTVIRDITERLAAERALRESEERFREFFENEPSYCYMVSPEGRIIDVNKAALRTLGYTKKELVGQPVEILYAPECRKRAGPLFEEWHREGSIENEEMAIITREGEVRYVLLSVGAVRDPDGAIIHSISVQRDITERKRAEESIRASLREKEVLLREIHHRVKNNMQVISSMMSLQAGYIEDDTMRQVFRESQQRVRSMALIHDKLYQSEDLGRIDFTEYVQSLGIHLLHTYGVEPDRIRFIVRGSEVYLDVEKGVPCGLIINELISNCLKHAFPDGRSGTIEVSIEERDGRVRIVVEDDGVGLPPDLDFRETDTLGLEIVTTLTAQIEGTIDIDRSGGTAFIIVFEAKGGGPDDA
ncbi:MAG TPA: PAS domain S-box protein, partial [Thermoplasmata archaeon]|nr:PAS domain S-box protein [Thermoplasmata archaeon]